MCLNNMTVFKSQPNLNKKAQELARPVEFLAEFSFNKGSAGKVAYGEREVGCEKCDDKNHFDFSGQRGM